MFHTPPRGRTRYFQMNTIAPPEIIPASAPHLLVLFQNSENRTTGPNEAPKPAHENDTILNTELSGSRAMNIAIIEIITTVTLAIIIAALFDILSPKKSVIISFETLEDAARS